MSAATKIDRGCSVCRWEHDSVMLSHAAVGGCMHKVFEIRYALMSWHLCKYRTSSGKTACHYGWVQRLKWGCIFPLRYDWVVVAVTVAMMMTMTETCSLDAKLQTLCSDWSCNAMRQISTEQLLHLLLNRGMFTMATFRPVLTETLPIPRLDLTGRAPPRWEITLPPPKTNNNNEDKVSN